MSEYNAESIKSLSFRDGVRQRIQMYLGSDDIEGTYQGLKEIINNSTDEALAGYGKKIEIYLITDTNEISVRDYGRGVPFLVKPNGENVLVDIYTKAHTGGKFDHQSYKNSSGLNGLGGSCVCLSSLKFRVESYRDKKKAVATFYKGELQSYKEEKTNEKNGTFVSFIPDPEVFSTGPIGYDIERICEDIKDISYLYPGITFIVSNEDGAETYCAKEGIVDFIKEKVAKPLNKHILHHEETDGTDSVEIAFQWGTKQEEAYTFVNGLRIPEHGTTLTGAKTAITKTFNSLCEKNFNGDKIRENMCLVMNCKVVNPSFANQTKSKINNPSLRTLCSKAFSAALKEMAEKYPAEFETIVNLMEKVEKAEAAATRARESILNFEKKSSEHSKKKITSSEKFKDCEKHGQDSMLVICEGNSALNGLMPARNVQTEALYAIRGKIINLLKHPLDECLANAEVSDIINALGCGIMDKYDSKKLRFGRVAIASDGDVDGKSIGCLIATMFYVLMPEFIQEGRLCWLQAPLFKLAKGKERVFAYNIDELNELKKTRSNWEQTRNKGLGEMSPEDMKASMLHPTNRHLDILTVDDYDAFCESINILMGPQVEDRREFLFENVDFSVINR